MMRVPGRGVTAILALVGVLMVTSAASAQALFRSDDVGFYDSTGRKVGTMSNWAEVVFRTNAGQTLFVHVSPSRLFGNASLHFPEWGCSGRPFLDRSGMGRRPSSWVGGPRMTVYLQAGVFRRQSMASTRTPFGECENFIADIEDHYAPAVPAGIDLADYFTPPFALGATRGEPVPIGAVRESLDPTDRIIMYDSTGKKVGATIQATLSPDVALVTDSGIVFLLGGRLPAWTETYFASTDCSGQRFMRDGPGERLFAATVLVGPRSAVYIRTQGPERRTMYSMMEADGDCMVLDQSDPGGYNDYWAPYAPLGIDLADYFTPPLTLRAGRGIRSLPTR